jgi:hypothetical protein
MTTRAPESLAVAALLFLTYTGFFQASTWGAACRFDLARAIAERGTIRIDEYHENTGDKALFREHYYSDKGPLPSLLAAPGVAAAHAMRAVTGKPASHAVWLAIAGGLATACASGLITALGGVVFFWMLRDRGLAYGTAWLVTMSVFLGTTLFPYATVLQGHAPAAAWLLFFFHAAFPATGAPGLARSFLAGVAASGAFATEYLTGPPLLVMGWLSLLRHREAMWQRKLAMALGATPGLLLLGIYHDAAFGSPFAVGYQHVALPFFQEKMSSGFFGIGAPNPVVAGKLLFGTYRGLFLTCPILLVALPGLFVLVRSRESRFETLAALSVPLFYLLLNSGYSTWHGGWAIGPRHLVPGIPFLALGLAVTMPRWRLPAAILGGVSVLFMLAATSVQPEVPEDIRQPIFGHVLPHFLRGELSIGEQGFGDYLPGRLDPAVPDRWDAFLLAEAIGLRGALALVPTIVVWIALCPLVVRRITGRAASIA